MFCPLLTQSPDNVICIIFTHNHCYYSYIFVKRHKIVTSETLGPGSVLLRIGKREFPGEEECL